MKYQQIQGWFDYAELYHSMVQWAPKNAKFVELGAWRGRSTAYLAGEIKRSRKNIQLDVVDTWQGTANEKYHRNFIAQLTANGRTLFAEFMHNMKACGVADYLRPVQKTSVEAAKDYENQSLDFVFIDADHTYKCVCQDIDAWLPKVRPGGVLAGHDYEFPDVNRAVKDRLGSGAEAFPPRSWIYWV
jgi:predicted O-methyltransferase YrrM